MVEFAKILLEFILIFIIVYVGYYLFSYKKTDKYNRKKAPINVKYLVIRYNIDVVRLGYKRVVKTLMLCDSLIIAVLFTATRFIDNMYIRLLIATILIFPLFAGVYHIVATHYKKESE